MAKATAFVDVDIERKSLEQPIAYQLGTEHGIREQP